MRIAPIGLLLLVLLTAGCMSAPATTPVDSSPAETATPTPAPAVADTITFDATSLSILKSDGQIETVRYDEDPDSVILALTGALGDPVVSMPEAKHCEPAHTKVSWGEGLTLYWGEDYFYIPDGQTITMSVSAAEVSGVELDAVGGISVGDSTAELMDLPGWEHRQSTEFADGLQEWVIVALGGGDIADKEAYPWGVLARAVDGTVDLLRAPGNLIDC